MNLSRFPCIVCCGSLLIMEGFWRHFKILLRSGRRKAEERLQDG